MQLNVYYIRICVERKYIYINWQEYKKKLIQYLWHIYLNSTNRFEQLFINLCIHHGICVQREREREEPSGSN